jgi:glycosyltransferase involved in cell wall biosynthesis
MMSMRGGEKVLEQLCLVFPGAPIHTIAARPKEMTAAILKHEIRTSPIGMFPGGVTHYKSLLPLFPAAVRSMRVSRETDLLFSSDASVIKGLSYKADIPHFCYCHSPPRYLWDLHDMYMKNTAGLGMIGRAVFKSITPRVRQFDYEAAQRVTAFIANSRFVQQRIQEFYGRSSELIHPPVDVEGFDPNHPAEDYYLIVSELAPYKRIDIAVDAFNRLGKRLVILGDGSEMKSLRARARPNIEFLGRQPFDVVKRSFERCRAFLYPQIEDFGITAVEAQAAGRPVIAFRKGGAVDSVIEGRTGLFFDEQSADCLADAVEALDHASISPAACRANAERFRPEVFRNAVKQLLAKELPKLFASPTLAPLASVP